MFYLLGFLLAMTFISFFVAVAATRKNLELLRRVNALEHLLSLPPERRPSVDQLLRGLERRKAELGGMSPQDRRKAIEDWARALARPEDLKDN